MTHILDCRGITLRLDKPLEMGIINLTPDSFQTKFPSSHTALYVAYQMISKGMDIIDIGAESTRADATPISAQVEIERLSEVIKLVAVQKHTPISIDTYKPEVAELALREGAHIINDVSGLADEDMLEVAARFKAPLVITHTKGTPQTMKGLAQYSDVVREVRDFLEDKVSLCLSRRVQPIIDPGFGFAKTYEHNYELLTRLNELGLRVPILVGTSGKKFTHNSQPITPKESRQLAYQGGARIFREHRYLNLKYLLTN